MNDSKFEQFGKLILWVGIPLGALIIIGGLLTLLFGVLISCHNFDHKETYSPSKTLKVVEYTFSCGATTPNIYSVSILQPEEEISRWSRANLFSTEKGRPVLNWLSADTLLIQYDYELNADYVHLQETKVNGVQIVYNTGSE